VSGYVHGKDRFESCSDIKTNNMGERIITFGCSESIHIYTSQSSVTPMWPYKSHKSIEDAKKHLTELRGIKEPNIIHT
jgi:hypothetical protein